MARPPGRAKRATDRLFDAIWANDHVRAVVAGADVPPYLQSMTGVAGVDDEVGPKQAAWLVAQVGDHLARMDAIDDRDGAVRDATRRLKIAASDGPLALVLDEIERCVAVIVARIPSPLRPVASGVLPLPRARDVG